MHILLIPSWYLTPTNPVRGNFFRNEALALHRAGHKVGVLIPPSRLRTWHGLKELRLHWRKPNSQIAITDDNGVASYRIPWWGWLPSINPYARGELGLKIFDHYCQEQGQPDVVHGQATLYGGYLAAYIGEKRRIPTVVTEYASLYVTKRIAPWQARIIRYTLRHADKRLVIAPSLVDSLLSFTPEQEFEILGCVVDVSSFTPPQSKIAPPPFIFAMVASLSPRKGHGVLLTAFSRVFRGKDVRLRIAGSGYEGAKLAKLLCQINELGIQNQVDVLGLISQKDLLDLMQNCHALVSSSYTETFGVSGIEALACGKPVVATRSGGPEFFINERNGILTPPGDVDAFATAMQRMVDTYDHYQPEVIRAECMVRFGEEAIVRRLEEIYESLTKKL